MLASILLLILDAAVGFLTFMLLARFYMQWARVSFRNQVGQFVVTTTDWLVRPVRRLVPGLFGLDLASLLPAWVLQTLFALVDLGLRGVPLNGGPGGLLLGLWGLGLLALLKLAIYLLIAVVLFSAILSWVNPHAPAAPLFNGLAAPFLQPIRRVLPPIANVDLSPLVLLLLLQVLLTVLASLAGGLLGLVTGR